MAPLGEVGPIWRSVRRHRAFSLLITEVALGFFIIGNLIMTIRWYASKTLPPSGHRKEDVVEVMIRRPIPDDAAAAARLGELRGRERAAIAGLPDVRGVAAVSATEIDDRWHPPGLFWSTPGSAAGASRCADVARGDGGTVVGWDVETEAALLDVVDLRLVEGSLNSWVGSDTAVITRCLADALFGRTPALGQTLYSNHHAPARVVGVVEDVRLRVPFLYQTQVTALYAVPVDDPRLERLLVRTSPGRAATVRAAIAPAVAAVGGDADARVDARLFAADETKAAQTTTGTMLLLLVVVGVMGTLAVLGNMAVAAFLVGDRRRIIGVRRALGASRWDIFRYLLIENLIPTQLGNLLGLVVVLATVPAARLRFSGITFDVTDTVLTALLLTTGGVLAKLLPALRATRIPPSEVTRSL